MLLSNKIYLRVSRVYINNLLIFAFVLIFQCKDALIYCGDYLQPHRLAFSIRVAVFVEY